MEEIPLIQGDNSDIYEFSTKDITNLDTSWEGSWAVSEALGLAPIISGTLTKNPDIFNLDSLVGEEIRESYKIFEPTNEIVTFNKTNINGTIATVSGTCTDANGLIVPNKYIYITLKGIFVPHFRTILVKTDLNGLFSVDIDLSPTVKMPANSFFIFQIMPNDSALLDYKKYFLTVEVRQLDSSSNVIFRKEVLQAKLVVNKQGVL